MQIPSKQHELLPLVVQEQNVLVDALLLHRKLQAKTRFNDWVSVRIRDYGFEEHKDYFTEKSVKLGAGRKSINYLLTLDMAKELAMLERNEVGRSIRRYFIAKEKELRGISQLPKEAALFAGLKPTTINGRKMYPYITIRQRCGYSTKSSSSGHRQRYPQHFVLQGRQLLITTDFALHLHHSKQVIANRTVLRHMQPVLPFNFGEAIITKGGVA